MVRFAVVGSGWRSLFYVRVAKALPERFSLCSLLCRTQAKADALHAQYDIPTTTSEDAVEALRPDFIVSAVSKADMYTVCTHWLEKGYAVLSETPVSLDFACLCDAWRRHCAGQRLAVAEQYHLYPTYAQCIRTVEAGKIGAPVTASLSVAHDYHAASLLRRLLQTGCEDVAVTGKTFTTSIVRTKTRYETLTDGALSPCQQTHLILEYASGKTAFYDFMSEQYRSTIRSRSLNVRGTRGEIVNDTVYFLGEDNLGRREALPVTNPYETLGLNEDEAAVAAALDGMARYVRTGEEFYPLWEALEDAYTATLMTAAGAAPYHTYRSGPRPWAANKEEPR